MSAQSLATILLWVSICTFVLVTLNLIAVIKQRYDIKRHFRSHDLRIKK